jgi:hypothetical protein
MSEQKKKILGMLAEGKISVDDAERLLAAVDKGEATGATGPAEHPESEPKAGRKPKFLCVKVNAKEGKSIGHGKHEHVNIRIPIALIKAGVKLGSVLPDSAKGKVSEKLGSHGIALDLNNLSGDSLDEFLEALQQTHIDIDDEDESVKICCE